MANISTQRQDIAALLERIQPERGERFDPTQVTVLDLGEVGEKEIVYRGAAPFAAVKGVGNCCVGLYTFDGEPKSQTAPEDVRHHGCDWGILIAPGTLQLLEPTAERPDALTPSLDGVVAASRAVLL